MKRWKAALIIVLALGFLTWMGVDSRADMAVVDEGDKTYSEVLRYQEVCYAELERLAKRVTSGEIDIATYQKESSSLIAEAQKFDFFIRARQDLYGASDSEIADFYREVFGWGFFPD